MQSCDWLVLLAILLAPNPPLLAGQRVKAKALQLPPGLVLDLLLDQLLRLYSKRLRQLLDRGEARSQQSSIVLKQKAPPEGVSTTLRRLTHQVGIGDVAG